MSHCPQPNQVNNLKAIKGFVYFWFRTMESPKIPFGFELFQQKGELYLGMNSESSSSEKPYSFVFSTSPFSPQSILWTETKILFRIQALSLKKESIVLLYFLFKTLRHSIKTNSEIKPIMSSFFHFKHHQLNFSQHSNN